MIHNTPRSSLALKRRSRTPLFCPISCATMQLLNKLPQTVRGMGMALLGGHQPIDFTEGLQQGKRHRLGNLAGFIVVVCITAFLSLTAPPVVEPLRMSSRERFGVNSGNRCHSESPRVLCTMRVAQPLFRNHPLCAFACKSSSACVALALLWLTADFVGILLSPWCLSSPTLLRPFRQQWMLEPTLLVGKINSEKR